jgi:hypothetical protein
MFNSEHPIIALAMNQVSDAKFAVACAEVGVFPSITIFNYYKDKGGIDYHLLVDQLLYFKTARGNSDFLFSMYHPHVSDKVLIKILKAAGVKILEIIMPWVEYDLNKFIDDVANLKEQGFTLMIRAVEYNKKAIKPARNGGLFQYFDVILTKGNKGAGSVSTQSLEEMFFITKNDYPDKKLVAAGGIHSKRQMNLFLENGAMAVGIGTLFAASTESCLSDQTKELMIQADFNKIKQTTYPEKNALVFKPIKTADPNYTVSLKMGMKRPDIGGHIYCGEAIDSITSILPLKEIVKTLVT